NIDAPNGYTITGEGKGGAAGFGKGGADIKLTDADGGTLLSYTATASVGGKMAQIGSRLIDSTAKKLAGEFFAKFNELVSEPAAEQAETAADDVEGTAVASSNMKQEAEDTQETPATPEKPGLMRPAILIPAAILAVAVIYYLSTGA
ncbi:MAG: SRPBCC domain-containing protein, partial [Sneathiella sp.]